MKSCKSFGKHKKRTGEDLDSFIKSLLWLNFFLASFSMLLFPLTFHIPIRVTHPRGSRSGFNPYKCASRSGSIRKFRLNYYYPFSRMSDIERRKSGRRRRIVFSLTYFQAKGRKNNGAPNWPVQTRPLALLCTVTSTCPSTRLREWDIFSGCCGRHLITYHHY